MVDLLRRGATWHGILAADLQWTGGRSGQAVRPSAVAAIPWLRGPRPLWRGGAARLGPRRQIYGGAARVAMSATLHDDAAASAQHDDTGRVATLRGCRPGSSPTRHGVDVNDVDHNGQTTLHWSLCVVISKMLTCF
uniref:Snrnp sm protein, putative n=1 Tax=Arundo donax TaxID=35708 RepID=A0A0A9TSH0_ARUDO